MNLLSKNIEPKTYDKLKLLYFDLETTGTNPAKHGIHQISGNIEIGDEIRETFDFKVRPNSQAIINEEALKIAGVTKEEILAYPSMKQIYNEFIAMLAEYIDKYDKRDKFFLVGFNNASFDNNFLRGFFLQNNDKYFGSWFWSNSFDVMVLASFHLRHVRYKMENFKLKTVAKELGIEVDESKLHDAMYDIFLTKEIFNRVKPI